MPLHVGGRRLGLQDDVDSALESLSFSYLDGVPFELDPRLSSALSSVETHLAKAKQLLERYSSPSAAARYSLEQDFDLSHIGRLEKQVLEQLQMLEGEREGRRKREEEMLKAFEERKEAQKEAEDDNEKIDAAEEKEEEAIKTKQAGDRGEESVESIETDQPVGTQQSSSSTEDLSAASTQPARSPVATFRVVPATTTAAAAAGPSLPAKENFNFSEFERESDPFERAELDTINDMQELAAVLQTTTSIRQETTLNHHSEGGGVAYGTKKYQPYYHLPSAYGHHQPPSPPPRHHHESALKSSKSVGDLMSEIQKETEQQQWAAAVAAAAAPEAKRLSNSRTPPPPPSSTGGGKDWVPWPDPDGETKQQEDNKLFLNLSPDSVNRCKRVHDMGFPLRRVTRVCKALGDDDQQMINFCLLVDKLGGDADAEHVLLLHSVDESRSRKHLEAFRKLVDFGFDRQQIHDALVTSNLDYNKTLEKLLAAPACAADA